MIIFSCKKRYPNDELDQEKSIKYFKSIGNQIKTHLKIFIQRFVQNQ